MACRKAVSPAIDGGKRATIASMNLALPSRPPKSRLATRRSSRLEQCNSNQSGSPRLRPPAWRTRGRPRAPRRRPSRLVGRNEPAATRTSARSCCARRRSAEGARLLTVLLAALLIAALAAAFWFLAPAAWMQRIGIAGGETPLQLMMTHSDRQKLASGNELLAVSGRVINPTNSNQDVPPIQAQLRSARASWSTAGRSRRQREPCRRAPARPSTAPRSMFRQAATS